MAVSNTNLRSPANGGYACNGSLVDFAGTFRLLDEADVLVVLTDSDGNLSELSLGAGDYTVAATGGTYPADSFTVTTASTYASGNTITLIRTMAYTQPSEYSDNGPFYPSNNEESYDRLCLQVQQLAEITDRCIKYESSTDTSGLTIVFDPDGSVLLSYLQPDSVTTSTIADSAVTYAKMQNVSATDKLLGRSTAGAGVVEEIACTAAGRALLDDADASVQRTTLGLTALATASVDDSTIELSGSTVQVKDSGITDAKVTFPTCKAWIRFNGTGTIAIDRSYGVDSIADISTGEYRITLTSAVAANAMAMVSGKPNDDESRDSNNGPLVRQTSTTTFYIANGTASAGEDWAVMYLAIFE